MRKFLEKAWAYLLLAVMLCPLLGFSAKPAFADGVAVDVQINWNDEGDDAGERPEELTLQLLKNGLPYRDPVQVGGEDALWHVSFANLPKGHDDDNRIV